MLPFCLFSLEREKKSIHIPEIMRYDFRKQLLIQSFSKTIEESDNIKVQVRQLRKQIVACAQIIVVSITIRSNKSDK